MPKQKVRQSVDEIATPDKAVEPVPTVRDDMPGDFMAFVRKALNAVNAKLDNIVSLQCSMEKKLADIDTRVTGQGSVIAGLTESVEFNAANITTQQTAIDIVKQSLVETNRDLQIANESRGETHYLRETFPFVQCLTSWCARNWRRKLVEDILHQKLNKSGSVIENAHRIGKQTQDKPRHIIARFHSRVVRTTVTRATRTNLRDSKLRFVDDLTKEDMQEKQRVRPLMNELFKTNRRPSFRNGTLYAEGRPVSEDEINRSLQCHQWRVVKQRRRLRFRVGDVGHDARELTCVRVDFS